MDLELLRISSQKDSTSGLLFEISNNIRKFLCYTLEDEYRTKKIHSETRIPAGVYKILLRKEGGFHQRYKNKFGSMHKGMLHLQDVEGFEYILIHVGNTDDDTAGCILIGDNQTQNIFTPNGYIGYSVNAYKRVYPPIAKALENGEEVKIKIIDYA